MQRQIALSRYRVSMQYNRRVVAAKINKQKRIDTEEFDLRCKGSQYKRTEQSIERKSSIDETEINVTEIDAT